MIKNKRKIVQFSPMRSGSTLVASLLRELFPGRTVRKLHSIESISRKLHLFALNFPVVSTCRYPLDVIASEMKAFDMKPTAKAIEEACQTIESRGLLQLKKVLNRKNVLLLKYEDYYENFDLLFDHFEDFFGINIDEKIRVQLSNDYSIKSVEKLTEGLTVHQFTDDNTHFHGRHISETKGKPGAYRSFFTEEQIEWLQHRFSDVIKDFGYCNTEIDNICAPPPLSISSDENVYEQSFSVNKSDRNKLNLHKGKVLWLTGLSGSGKSTIANFLEQILHKKGIKTYILDGDNVRQGLCKDLDFTEAGRIENIRRVTEVAKLMVDAGIVVITAFISPFTNERQIARSNFQDDEFIEIYISTPLEIAEKRDKKGLYKKARCGELLNFTGIDSPYEVPVNAEYTIDTSNQTSQKLALELANSLKF